MLKTTKSVSLSGQSTIEGQQVVYLNANVSTETAGNTNISQTIQNQELYMEHRKECRADVDAFQEQVWAIEDEMLEEMKVGK